MRFKISAKLFLVEMAMLFLVFTMCNILRMDGERRIVRVKISEPEPIAYFIREQNPETMFPTKMPETSKWGEITQEEKEILLQIAMAEAEGESTEGKAMVMAVVLNRMESEDFPDNMKEVVFQESQFAVMGKNGRYFTTTPNEDCGKALELIESGWDESKGALYFESGIDGGWHSQNLEFLFKLGGHRFYR